MSNPVVVEVTRGQRVESRHRGAGAVVDADGGIVLAFGDVDLPVYPRSAVKAFQALPLIESGAADRFAFSDAEIALACASHAGEPGHVETAAGMLAKAGRDAGALECGVHWPLGLTALRELARSGGEPSALHNNCSGKHAGFVCLSCAIGEDPAGYVQPEHAVQREVKAALESMTGTRLGPEDRGVDGCAIPTYAIPLTGLAHGFARFGTGHGLGEARRAAAARIRAAVAAQPWMVGGTGKFDTDVMKALGERAFTKTGAEGVFCAALPELGLGIAVKADDGASRAAEAMTAALLQRFLKLEGEAKAALKARGPVELTNWNGTKVGTIRTTGPLAQ
jgi:L-asparaginase II